MQAIQTRYYGPTNHKGSRIKAWCDRGSMYVSYPHELSGQACHEYAAAQLIARFVAEDLKKYGPNRNTWERPRACGQLPTGDYAHVYLD